MKELVLVTGGAGFIGSHLCVALARANIDFVVLDNFRNSRRSVIPRLARICGKPITLFEADVCDAEALAGLFARYAFTAVVHFAADKAVGESVRAPLPYYHNNVVGTVQLLEAMAEAGVRKLVFSSSATVYGPDATVPYTEDAPLAPANPYGETKLAVEKIIHDVCHADDSWRVTSLRYFNPVGAHESGLIGEAPNGIPNNLLPYVAQVAEGRRDALSVFGGDYPTPDGTGVRDYIHVVDLAVGHLKALDKLAGGPGIHTWNLGTGHGYSVLDMVRAFEAASGKPVPYKIVDRRPGDIASCYADTARAERELGWKARYDIARMCTDAWRWQSSPK